MHWYHLLIALLKRFISKMGVIKRVVKPRNQRSKRALEAKEPKAIENAKSALFIRGPKSSDMVMKAMKDILALKKPNVAPEFYGKSKITIIFLYILRT